MPKKSNLNVAEAEDVGRERLPDIITREQFKKWMDGLASEIVAGGCLASDPESKAHNAATFRAQRLVKSYKEGHGLFQYGD